MGGWIGSGERGGRNGEGRELRGRCGKLACLFALEESLGSSDDRW
jgi:hypothetical protein